jgi:dUTP pyrophosphatase
MQNITVQVKKLSHFKGELPQYETLSSSGFDIRAQLAGSIVLKPGARTLIPTGLSFAIPDGFEIQVRSRSGWSIKKGLVCLNSPGTIDADYRGEVKVIIANLGTEPVELVDQDRIAQLVLVPVYRAQFEVVEELSETIRGEGGFGSTGLSTLSN